jgi:rod shape-determining protein MreC
VSSELTSRVNKERAVLVTIPLLLLHLVVLSLQIEDPSGTLLFRTWILTAQAPVVALSSSISHGVRYIWNSYVWMVGARSENRQLQETVRHLSLVNSSYEQVRQENARLLRLLSINEKGAFKTLGARVVARAPGFLSNVIYIDRGTSDGIRNDQPVISGDGIVGRTVLVSRNQAQVQLITNPDASVGVMLERTRTPGVLRGSGDFLLDLNYIGNSEQVENGEVVFSSGMDGIFPKGLAIGKVVDSRKGKGVFRSIKILPFMDLMRVEEVSVILEEPKPIPDAMPPASRTGS